ncbi:MAG: hypothetical protein PW792_10530 [Acidobacteriaceae bacterium]|nr:hypothetical protein [Acidobacteriaceae bacterium]
MANLIPPPVATNRTENQMPIAPWKELIKKSPLGLFLGREVWALVDQGLVSAVSFLTNVMLARFMGLHEFGQFALTWMAILFVNSLQTALIVAPMMSIGPKQEEKDRPLYFGAVVAQEICLLLLCFSFIFFGVRTCSGVFHHPEISHLALPLAVAAFAYQGQDFVRRYFFATRQSQRALWDDALSYLPQLLLIGLLHRAKLLNSASALWAMAATSILGLIIGSFWLERIRFQAEWIRMIWWRHWKISRWLTGSALLVWTSSNLFILSAPVYYGVAAAGVLKASQNVMGVANIWFLGLENIVPAESARQLHVGGLAAMLRYIRSVIWKWGGLTFLYAALISIMPGLLLKLIYGPQMGSYGYVLRLYAALYLISFIGGPLRAGLQALEFTMPVFFSYLVMTGFAFVFAMPMAKWLGMSGSLLGLLSAQIIFQGIVGISLVWKARHIRRHSEPALQSN